jgi:hypothetical protein
MVRIIKNIILGGLTGIVLLLGMEVYFRSAGIVDRSFTSFTEEAGRVRPAGHQYITFNEGFGIGVFNEGRYLGPYTAPSEKMNEFRIALLGDSYVESFQVFERHKYSAILQAELERQTGMNIAVMNFGRSGFDLEDMVVYEEVMVKDYSPDLLLYFLSNEDYYPRVSDVLVPRAQFKDDTLVVVRDYPESYLKQYLLYQKLFSKSYYFNMVSNCQKQVKSGLLLPKLLDKFYLPVRLQENDVNVDTREVLQALPNVSNDLLKYIAGDPRSVIIHLSQKELIPEAERAINDLQIPAIDLRPVLDSLESAGVNPYYWEVTGKSGHWNHVAHDAIGKYLAIRLKSYLPMN